MIRRRKKNPGSKRCTSCKGVGTFRTLELHPKGAGHKVPCSRCGGNGEEPQPKQK